MDDNTKCERWMLSKSTREGEPPPGYDEYKQVMDDFKAMLDANAVQVDMGEYHARNPRSGKRPSKPA